MLITIFSALLFTVYIVYDTYQIWTRLSPEGMITAIRLMYMRILRFALSGLTIPLSPHTSEYIIGAIDLYLDIINVFLSVLTLLGMGNK